MYFRLIKIINRKGATCHSSKLLLYQTWVLLTLEIQFMFHKQECGKNSKY